MDKYEYRKKVIASFEELNNRDLATVQQYGKYTENDFETWKKLYENQIRQLADLAHIAFFDGLKNLGLTSTIPEFVDLDRALTTTTGWGIYVCGGTLSNATLYAGLKRKKFPVTNFLRDLLNWLYTEAPDMFHEIFGHLPFLTLQKYCEAVQIFGEIAEEHFYSPAVVKKLRHLFWFLVEFVLVRGHGERRIAGPGILSSVGEATYAAASSKPIIHTCGDAPQAMMRFIETAMRTPYDITKKQIEYFQVESYDLYHEMITKHMPSVVGNSLRKKSS